MDELLVAIRILLLHEHDIPEVYYGLPLLVRDVVELVRYLVYVMYVLEEGLRFDYRLVDVVKVMQEYLGP